MMLAERGSGRVCINGAAAHRIFVGDKIIVVGFELADKAPKARKVLVDDKNKFVRYL